MEPGSSPVPRWIARLILSAGMFSALAAATAPRKRGLASGSPPPWRAAMVISLIRRVKILPRFASSAPFLCLIVAHLEWPDMETSTASEFAVSLAAKGEYSIYARGLSTVAAGTGGKHKRWRAKGEPA